MGIAETSTYPGLTIEWLPGVAPGTVAGSWSDITTDVMAGTVQRGRQYELDRFAAGTMTLQLNAQTRKYDPEWTSGTYFGQLIPMAQIRVTATWSAVTYPVFYGYVTDWGQTVQAEDRTFWTTITAVDGFVLLEQLQLPSSAWALEVLQEDPDLWFRLGETDTARVTDSSDGGNYGIYDNVEQGAQGLVPNDADGAVFVRQDTDNRVTIQNPNLITGYPFTVSAFINLELEGVDDTADGNIFYSFVTTYGGGVHAATSLSVGRTDYTVRASTQHSGGSSTFTRNRTTLGFGRTYHIVWVATSSAAGTMYVDGSAAQSTNGTMGGTFPGLPQDGQWHIGNHSTLTSGNYGLNGTIDEVAVWTRALSGGTIASLALAGLTGWDGDDTGARVTRFLDAINWPASLRDIASGISVLGPANWSRGTSALSVLQDWADTEYGMFHMAADGDLVWRSRHYRYLAAAATTSQATFGDARSGEALVYLADGFELPRDEALIRNPVQASRAGGITVEVKDQTLIDNKYWYRSWASPPTQDQKDSAVRDRATWLLARYKEQTTRLKAMRIRPARNPSGLWPQVLGRLLGDRITVKRTPLGTGNQISTQQHIEAIRHEFAPRFWTTTFVGSPVEDEDYLVLNDASRGLLNTGVLAY